MEGISTRVISNVITIITFTGLHTHCWRKLMCHHNMYKYGIRMFAILIQWYNVSFLSCPVQVRIQYVSLKLNAENSISLPENFRMHIVS